VAVAAYTMLTMHASGILTCLPNFGGVVSGGGGTGGGPSVGGDADEADFRPFSDGMVGVTSASADRCYVSLLYTLFRTSRAGTKQSACCVCK